MCPFNSCQQATCLPLSEQPQVDRRNSGFILLKSSGHHVLRIGFKLSAAWLLNEKDQGSFSPVSPGGPLGGQPRGPLPCGPLSSLLLFFNLRLPSPLLSALLLSVSWLTRCLEEGSPPAEAPRTGPPFRADFGQRGCSRSGRAARGPFFLPGAGVVSTATSRALGLWPADPIWRGFLG